MTDNAVWLAIGDRQEMLVYKQALLRLRIQEERITTFSKGITMVTSIRNTAGQLPALLLIDADLPGMSGIEVIKTLHGWNMIRQMQVIMLSDNPTARESSIAMVCKVCVHPKSDSVQDAETFLLKILGGFEHAGHSN